MKNSDIFHSSAPNIDCWCSLEPPRRGGSNEYSQSMFLSRNKQNNVYPCKPQFYYIKVGFKGVKLYRHVFVMCILQTGDMQGCTFLTDLYNLAIYKSVFKCVLGGFLNKSVL